MSKALVPFRTDGTLTFNLLPEAVKLRDSIIEKSKLVLVVNDAASANRARENVAALKGLVSECETCRVAEKAPAKEYCEKIDEETKVFKLPANTETARVEHLLSVFIAGEQKKEREQAERIRLAALKEVQEREARDAEIAEALRKSKEATNAKERQAAAEKAKALADAEAQREMDASMEAPAPAPVFINTKVAGAAVKRTPQIMVHDLHELYEAHPQCVTLKENLNAIKDLIRLAESKNQPINIPGVEVSFITDVQVKKSSTKLQLQ